MPFDGSKERTCLASMSTVSGYRGRGGGLPCPSDALAEETLGDLREGGVLPVDRLLARIFLDKCNVTRYTDAVIKSFRDKETKAIFDGEGVDPKDAKKARKRLPTTLWRKARAKLDQIDVATDPEQLNTPSNHLEALSRDREGQQSIWINDQYRICFEWFDGDAYDVEITDYH